MTDAKRKRTSGIDRALQVMDILTERQEPTSAYDLAKSAGAPVSTIYRIVDELVERDMLSRTDGSRVWLGPRLMRYGLLYRARMDMFAQAKREMQRLSQQIGRPLTVQEAQAFGIHAQVLGQMVTEALLDEQARLAGIAVSDEAVRASILEDPTFQSAGGRFDRGFFEQYLRFNGMTEPLFVERQRQFLARQIVGESIGGGGRVPETLRDVLAEHRTDVRQARYFRIELDTLPALELPSEEDLRAYFDANTARFDAPEYRKVGVIALTPETVSGEIEITTDDARAYYDSRIDRYSVAEPCGDHRRRDL